VSNFFPTSAVFFKNFCLVFLANELLLSKKWLFHLTLDSFYSAFVQEGLPESIASSLSLFELVVKELEGFPSSLLFLFELFCAYPTMQRELYKGIVGLLKHGNIGDVPRSVWCAAPWRYTKEGRTNSDRDTKRRFRKFANQFKEVGE